LLIAEGSDWNWWYGPEHHSANDRDFDELYRKHLSNVYQALGAVPPDYLSQPISGGEVRPAFVPQTAYIRPRIAGDMVRYFEWMGAAAHTADQRAGAMHGKQFLLDAIHAGIDDTFLYGRLDFAGLVPQGNFALVVSVECKTSGETAGTRVLRLDAEIADGKLQSWSLNGASEEPPLASSSKPDEAMRIALAKNFEFRVPLSWIGAFVTSPPPAGKAKVLRLRFSLWQNRLPADALPVEGWLELALVGETELLG
jgi:hypothetical protein